MKHCKTCGIAKSRDSFYKDKSKPDGLHGQCKECRLKKVAEYRDKNRSILAKKATEYRSRNIDVCRERERKYSAEHSAERDARVKLFLANNPEKKREYERRYLSKPEAKEKQRIRGSKYARHRRLTDPLYVVRQNCRSRMHSALRAKGIRKQSSTEELLGCSCEYLRSYIASMFEDGMSWDNYGSWHIDHIVPLASAKSEEELFALCHYTNLQPLWAADNIKKGARLDYCPA